MEKQSFKVSEIKISYRPSFRIVDRPQITSSRIAYEILRQSWDSNKLELLEEFKVVMLNRQNRVLGIINIAQGGFSEVMVDLKVVFSVALKCCASGILLAHNHPSCELRASEADIWLTRKLAAGGAVLGIEVHDQVIISAYGYHSFMDNGMM